MVAANYRCSFDGVTEGANINAANTMTGSGSVINLGSSTAPTALLAAAIRGGKGGRINATAVDQWLYWTFTAAASVTTRVYFTVSGTSDPTVLQDWLQIRNASARAASCRMTTAGVIQAHDAGGTVRFTSTTKPANGDYVLTIEATKGTTTSNGEMKCWLRNAADDSLVSTTPAGGTAITGINTGTTDYTSIRVGKTSSSGNWLLDFDEPAVAWGATAQGEIDLVSLTPAPGADAGVPQTVEPWSTVILDGTESEGAIDTWTWTLTAVTGAVVTGTGPWTVTDSPFVGTVTLASSNTSQPTFAAPADTEDRVYTFTLTTSASGTPSTVSTSVDITVMAATEFCTVSSQLRPLRLQYEA